MQNYAMQSYANPRHIWLNPKLKPQADALRDVGFSFIGDSDKYYGGKSEGSFAAPIDYHTIGKWKNVLLLCVDFDVLDAILDGGLYCLEIDDACTKKTVKSVKKRLNAAFIEPQAPQQLTLNLGE